MRRQWRNRVKTYSTIMSMLFSMVVFIVPENNIELSYRTIFYEIYLHIRLKDFYFNHKSPFCKFFNPFFGTWIRVRSFLNKSCNEWLNHFLKCNLSFKIINKSFMHRSNEMYHKPIDLIRFLNCVSLSGYTFETSNPSRRICLDSRSSFLLSASPCFNSSLTWVVLPSLYCIGRLRSWTFSSCN